MVAPLLQSIWVSLVECLYLMIEISIVFEKQGISEKHSLVALLATTQYLLTNR